MTTQRQTLEGIARKHFSVDTLETQNSDSLDFHDVAIWNIKQALLDAYRAGYADSETQNKK